MLTRIPGAMWGLHSLRSRGPERSLLFLVLRAQPQQESLTAGFRSAWPLGQLS